MMENFFNSGKEEKIKEEQKKWRHNMAKELVEDRALGRSEEDVHGAGSEIALNLLADQKGYDVYSDSEIARRQEKLDERQQKEIITAVSSSDNYETLKNIFLSNDSLKTPNHHLGGDHGYNLVKKMEMAKIIGDLNIVPEVGGLRAKMAEFFPVEFSHYLSQTEKDKKYQDFLQNRFPDLKFSDVEIDRIIKKIPTEVFGSVDASAEKSILLLNAIKEIKTIASCGGHFDAQNIDEQNYINHFMSYPYVYFKISPSDYDKIKPLQDALIKIKETNPNVFASDAPRKYKKPGEDDEVRFTWRYKLLPSLEYIKSHGKMSQEEIEEKSNSELKEMLGVDVSGYSKDGKVDMERMQRDLFIRKPEMALGGLDTFGNYPRLSKKIAYLFPEYQKYQEYKEYYHSSELRTEVNDFFSKVNEVLNKYRQESKE